MLPRCRAEVGHWPPIASTRGRRWIQLVNDQSSSDDTRSRGTGRVHGGAAQSAVQAGTVNAADVVTVQHLVKRYGHLFAVNDVSFSIREGEIFGIIGPNGAGKTTCVECISGLRAPDSGSISVYGFSPQKDRDRIRELVGVQLQESALPPRLKVGEAVRLFASFYANPLDPDELLESLGIKQIE